MLPIVKKAAKIVGGISELARQIGAPRPALYVWKSVPVSYAKAMVKATGGKITLAQLRPDVWGAE